jgi:sterol desaturase/sphingolipid hydroxylase (fatty acid hydroxylase superfamily)
MTLPLSLLAWLTHMAVFHGLGLAFAWSDRHGKLRRFKVRARDHRSYGEMLPRVLFNQCFILLPIALSCQFLGLAYVGPPHLSLAWFLAGLLLMAVGHDVVQYPAHRWLLHGRRFRWLGHDLHHSIKPACSIGACFMSGPDFFLEIVCPYLVPLILIGGGGSDVAFHLVVAGFASMGGVYEHSALWNHGAVLVVDLAIAPVGL